MRANINVSGGTETALSILLSRAGSGRDALGSLEYAPQTYICKTFNFHVALKSNLKITGQNAIFIYT